MDHDLEAIVKDLRSRVDRLERIVLEMASHGASPARLKDDIESLQRDRQQRIEGE